MIEKLEKQLNEVYNKAIDTDEIETALSVLYVKAQLVQAQMQTDVQLKSIKQQSKGK